MIELLGKELVAELRRVGEIYQKGELRPVEPDLIAWREVNGQKEWLFVEVLMDGDALRKGQLLGLTLLALVAKGQSTVWRFIDYDKWVDYRNKVKRPKEHKDRFQPRVSGSAVEAAPAEPAPTPPAGDVSLEVPPTQVAPPAPQVAEEPPADDVTAPSPPSTDEPH